MAGAFDHGLRAPFIQVLQQCHPSIIRRGEGAETTNRKGISEPELLRALSESGAFERFRDRKAVKMASDPTGAGMCVFKNLRWRDPSLPADLKFLREQHKRLAKKYSSFAAETTLDVLVSTLKQTIVAWNAARNPEHVSSPRSTAAALRLKQDDTNESTPGRSGKRPRQDEQTQGDKVSKAARSKAASPSLSMQRGSCQPAARPNDASDSGACRRRENLGAQGSRRTASRTEVGAAPKASGSRKKHARSCPPPRSSTRLANSEVHQASGSSSAGPACAAFGNSSAGRNAQCDSRQQVLVSQPGPAASCWEQGHACAKTDEWSRTESAGTESVGQNVASGEGEGLLWEMLPVDECDMEMVGLQADCIDLVPPTAILPPDARSDHERDLSRGGGVQKKAAERCRDRQEPGIQDTALAGSDLSIAQSLAVVAGVFQGDQRRKRA
jgi:hypothetical protein